MIKNRRFSGRFHEDIGSRVEIKIRPLLKCEYEGFEVDVPEEAESEAFDEAVRILEEDVAEGLNLAEYAPDNLKSVLEDVQMEIDPDFGDLLVVCTINGEATPDVVEAVVSYIKGQMSDGWGEGFEQQELATVPVYPVYVDGTLECIDLSANDAADDVDSYKTDDDEDAVDAEYEEDVASVYCSYWSPRMNLMRVTVDGIPFTEARNHRFGRR